MYWLTDKKKGDKGEDLLFYEFFVLSTDYTHNLSELVTQTVMVTSEEQFLDYYSKNKVL